MLCKSRSHLVSQSNTSRWTLTRRKKKDKGVGGIEEDASGSGGAGMITYEELDEGYVESFVCGVCNAEEDEGVPADGDAGGG